MQLTRIAKFIGFLLVAGSAHAATVFNVCTGCPDFISTGTTTGGSPGGTGTQIQYKSGSSFAGVPGSTVSATGLILSSATVSGQLSAGTINLGLANMLIPYFDASGTLVASVGLSYDNSLKNLIIGNATGAQTAQPSVIIVDGSNRFGGFLQSQSANDFVNGINAGEIGFVSQNGTSTDRIFIGAGTTTSAPVLVVQQAAGSGSKVGISTASPQATLDVNGGIKTVDLTVTGTCLGCGTGGGGNTVASPQYQVPYYNVSGSSTSLLGNTSFYAYPSSITFIGVSSTTYTNVSSWTLTNAYFDVSSSTANIGQLLTNGSAGTSGQVLTSSGTGFPAYWSTATGGVTFPVSQNVSFTNTSSYGILGSTLADNAAAGNVGEVVVSSKTTDQNLGGSAVWGDINSVAISSGDWMLMASADFNAQGNAGVTSCTVGISTTTGNSSAGLVSGFNRMGGLGPATTNDVVFAVLPQRISFATTKTIYQKFMCTYGAGATPTATGGIWGWRVR